jgi:putative isomerase
MKLLIMVEIKTNDQSRVDYIIEAYNRTFNLIFRSTLIGCCVASLLLGQAKAQSSLDNSYRVVQQSLQKGWGTYNHKSVLSHVLLPDGIALNIGVKLITSGNYLHEAYISSRDDRHEKIIPGPRAHDGSYSELTITWQEVKFKVQSATDSKQNIVLLITPLDLKGKEASIILETGLLWNKSGTTSRQGKSINVKTETKSVDVHYIGEYADEYVATTAPYLSVKFNKAVAFYTGETKTLTDIEQLLATQLLLWQKSYEPFGSNAGTHQAMQNVLAWNTIYDAARQRVITPVSRLWNDYFGGQSVLFCWDTYFAAYMLSTENKNLAYANAIEITKSITQGGFVPNWTGSYQQGSYDRSQPPVGSLVFKELYRKYQEKWILEYVFSDLLKWNQWWEKHRDSNGFLCWGSTPEPTAANEDQSVNTWQGAAYESGLDNSPMFDNVPFNKQTHLMEQADVGLMSLYILDCASLAEIAKVLHKDDVYAELKKRESKYKANLQKLWNEKAGIFMNKRTDTNEFSTELSPTNFYPLLAKAATDKQAARMIKEHLLNPEEFNGEWILPSISYKSTAFRDQNYWRGRIWAPMNFLVYISLLNYDVPVARKILVEKSNALFEKNLNINGCIFENYNGITGNVSDQVEGRKMGDNYYHWGALLGFISLIENGDVQNPQRPLSK